MENLQERLENLHYKCKNSVSEENWRDVISYCNRALKINENTSWALNNLACNYMEFKRFDEAEKCYNKLLSLENVDKINKSAAHTNYSIILMKKQQFDRALEENNKALELMPDLETAVFNKYLSLVGLKKGKEARKVFKQYKILTKPHDFLGRPWIRQFTIKYLHCDPFVHIYGMTNQEWFMKFLKDNMLHQAYRAHRETSIL